MRDRFEAVRKRLAEEHYEAFFSLSPPANQYLTGFMGTTSAVIITAREALFLCDFRYVEQAGAQVRDYEVHEVAGTLETRVGERLKALGVASAAFDGTVLSVWQADMVGKAFDGALCSEPGLLSRLRRVKSPEEVTLIRAAAELTDEVVLEVADALQEGVTERELAARIEFAFKERGAQGPSFDTIALFGARSSLPHGMPCEKRLEKGDIVLIDCGCRCVGYCSDLTRTYAYGTMPDAWFEEIYSVTLTAQEAALAALRPGVPCREADAIARNLIGEAGYGAHFGHGLGHGVGIEVHESPRLNAESDVTLEEGMVITVEPGIYLPGRGGVRIEDLVVITGEGCDILSRTPKRLEVLNG